MAEKKEMLLTRIFNAPREMVFNAWVDEKQMAQWWGPRGFTNPVCKLDVKPGGAILIRMEGMGHANDMHGTFNEIVAPEKIVFTTRAFDTEILNTLIFEDMDGKTRLTIHAEVIYYPPALEEAIDGMNEGWKQSMDKLDEFINNINH